MNPWAIVTMTVGLVAATPACAHALLIQSDPVPHEHIAGTKLDILLHYNSRIDADRSRLSLSDGGGGKRKLDSHGGEGPADLSAVADHLNPGDYVLHWEVLSVDGHISRGDLPFTVTAP